MKKLLSVFILLIFPIISWSQKSQKNNPPVEKSGKEEILRPAPIDPQIIQDQDDMTWADYHPIPGGLSSIGQGENSGTITHDLGHFAFDTGDNNNNPYIQPYREVNSITIIRVLWIKQLKFCRSITNLKQNSLMRY
jgi:hypothetical protein